VREAKRIRRWHERAYELGQAEAAGGDQQLDYLGLTLSLVRGYPDGADASW
jgi:hypothetical protein